MSLHRTLGAIATSLLNLIAMKKLFALIAVLSFLTSAAQHSKVGILKGKVLTVNSAEPIPFVNIQITNNKTKVIATTSDWEGNYAFLKLDTGVIDVRFSYVGYEPKEIKSVKILPGKAIVLNIALSKGVNLREVVVQEYSRPLFEKDQTTVESTTARQNIEIMAVRSVSDIAKVAGNGVVSRDNGSSTNVRGQRSGSSVVYIDGVKVVGSTNLPKSAIEEVKVQTGGVSAQYENNVSYDQSELRITSDIPTKRHYNSKRVKVKKTKEELFFEQAEEVVYHENELYQEIADNPFESPLKTPLSTFSIDVDKASYANTRRFLNQGMFPPVNAVRIEEMINYFNYDYPQPEGEHPFSITTELTDCPWNKKRKLALIGIQGEKVEMDEAPPSNLVFLLDVSGSMGSPNKIGLLKKGLSLLIDKLRDEDRLAIVVYAGAAGLVLESTAGKHRKEIKKVLNKLEAGGSTAGGAGIQLAYKVAQRNFIENGNNRIILATDGDFNVGTSTQEALVKLIEKKRESGVFLSVLGLGSGNLQDYKMEQLANKGNGNYNYLDNILEAKKVLINEMGGTLYTIAKDVKVQAEFNPTQVKAYRLIGYVNRALADQDFNDDTKDAGELGSGHTVTVLYEIVPAGSLEKIMDVDELKYQKQEVAKAQHSDELLTVKFRYKKPKGTKSVLLTKVMENRPKALEESSNNLRFAAAVASFGMKLRKSESAKTMKFEQIVTLAKNAKGKDEEGYRSEFIKLVEMADLMK